MASVLAALDEAAAQHPDRLLYAFLDVDGRTTESYTYAQFVQRSADIAAHLQRRGHLAAGERVLLLYPPGLEMICAFFACVRAGLIPVPAYPPTSTGFSTALSRLEFIARDCGAAAVLTTRAYALSMRVNEARHRVPTLTFARSDVTRLPWIVSTDADRGAPLAIAHDHPELLFLQYTSGSTSEPKGVMVTHDNLLANCEAVVDHLPIGVSWLPQYHDMGLIGYYLFFALKGGTTYGFSPLDFIQRPALWLETITRVRGTASSAPNFAYEYCLRQDKLSDEQLAGVDLRSLRFLMTAAEPIRADVCRDFLRRFEPYGLSRRSFFAAYGLAEFTLAVSNYGRRTLSVDRPALLAGTVVPAGPDAEPATSTALVSCGVPLGDTEIAIVDPDTATRHVGEAQVGEIWIRGRSKCQGYWERPALSQEHFEARLATDPTDAPTWLRSGDLGFVLDGEVYVCGRRKDVIIIRGLNYHPQDIEVLVSADDRLRRGGVAAFAVDRDGHETLVVVAEVKDPQRLPDVDVLNRRLQQGLGVTAATFVFIRARSLPKTSSGKVARHIVRQRWTEGRLAVASERRADAPMPSPDLPPERAWLQPFGLRGDEPHTLEDAGFDSLRLVAFAHAVKARLEARGDTVLARAVDLRVLPKVVIAELVDLVEQVGAGAPFADLRLQRMLADLGREQQDSDAALMRADSVRRATPDTMPLALRHDAEAPGRILLTGGTGFFGPFLLASLLRQETAEIDVLVRPSDADPLQRLRDGLLAIAPAGSDLPSGWERRVHVVVGDLARPSFGLTSTAWEALCARVRTIYHNGAVVNYLLDYRALRDANVGGTHEVLRLATSRRLKVVNHISTTFIFGWSVQETLSEQDTNAAMERLDFGYSPSKWVAEHVMHRALRDGVPGRIFRPALLTPTIDGGGANLDIAIRLLAFMITHGLSTSAQNQVSFSPADAAADNIVAIARSPDSLGGTFHVTRDEYANLADVTALVSALTGRTFHAYPLADFVPEVIARCRPGDCLFPLLDFLVRSVDHITAMEFKRYDNRAYRHFRDASEAGRADAPLVDVVRGMLRFMQRRHLIPD